MCVEVLQAKDKFVRWICHSDRTLKYICVLTSFRSPHYHWHSYVLQMKETIMNQEKLAKLQAQVRIGGKVRADNKTNIKTLVM